mgnify:CR=1 FL=1
MAKDNNRVMTLHPDEHVHIIIDRLGNAIEQMYYIPIEERSDGEERNVVQGMIKEQIDELEALRSYLRAQRLGDYS